MGEFKEAAEIVASLTRKAIAEEGHHSNPGIELDGRSCLRVAGSLQSDLKKTIERAKKRDFTGTVIGLMVIAQDKGALEACGLKLDHAALINAMQAVCPRNWDIIEDQLKAFGAEAYKRLYPES